MKSKAKSVIRTGVMATLLLPYIVAFRANPADTSVTTIRFGAGIGSYADVHRDCSGNIVSIEDIPFKDAGVAVDHDAAPFRVGAKAGLFSEKKQVQEYRYSGGKYVATPMREEIRTSWYVIPNLGLHWKYFGIDAGMLWFPTSDYTGLMSALNTVNPQGRVRIGNRDSWFFSIGVFDNTPLVSGGGLVDMGLGFCLDKRRSTLWLTIGGGPFDGTMFSVKGDIAISQTWMLNVRASTGGESETAASVGGGFRF